MKLIFAFLANVCAFLENRARKSHRTDDTVNLVTSRKTNARLARPIDLSDYIKSNRILH